MAYTDIDKPSDYFNTKLYTGNGGTQTISGVGFEPDWTWIKVRSTVDNHSLEDQVRGANKTLKSDTTGAEFSSGTVQISSWNSDGFALGSADGQTNGNGQTYASWNWKAGTSFTNDASSTGIGDIDSSGSVNTDAGFSIITATSDGASNKDIAHGLGAVPDVIFAKNLVRSYNWDCYFKTLGYNASLVLNETNATRTGAWGSNTFTTTTFETADDYSSKSGEAYIYYCFAEKKGYSKFGSYVGNGSSDGAFVYTGFKPAYIMTKRSSTAGNSWRIYDNTRDLFNEMDNALFADTSAVEGNYDAIDFVSNGFKWRGSSAAINGSGSTYVYMVFAENPFVTSTGIPTPAR